MRRCALACFAVSIVAAASASATPISASESLTGSVAINGVTSTNVGSASWGTLLSPLSTTVFASVSTTLASGLVTASVRGNIAANWGPGGNSGSIDFTNYGWGSSPFGSSEQASLDSAGPDWRYTFTADAAGTFTMAYNVTASGNPFGLWGWSINWSGPGGGLPVTNANDPTTSGTFARAVVAGQTYTVSLMNNANISSAGSIGTGSMDGAFDFVIRPATVPEPLTLSLFGMGLVGLAGMRRDRKKR